MMKKMGCYYHATITVLRVGENAGPKDCRYSEYPERQRLEDFLENKRPEEACSRLTSWFACDTPATSARYLEAELRHRKIPEGTGQPKTLCRRV